MIAYEVIDAICDAVNPALFIVAIGIAGFHCLKKNYKYSLFVGMAILYGLFVTYGILLIDTKIHLWKRMGMDYSTHTAFAFSMCFVIAVFLRKPMLMSTVFIGYILAMVYQKYHTVADIFTTIFALSLLIAPLFILVKRYCKKTKILHADHLD